MKPIHTQTYIFNIQDTQVSQRPHQIHHKTCKQVSLWDIICILDALLTHSPLTAATRVRYPASACEMVMWSPSQTGGFPPGTPVSSHTKTIRTQTSMPTSMINISCITCFVIVVKQIKFKLKMWQVSHISEKLQRTEEKLITLFIEQMHRDTITFKIK